MINSKIKLISEQNKMIYIIYIMLSSFKDTEIRQYFHEKMKGKKETEDKMNYENDLTKLSEKYNGLIEEKEKYWKKNMDEMKEKYENKEKEKNLEIEKLKEELRKK